VKPEFLTALEKILGPVRAHDFVDKYFHKVTVQTQLHGDVVKRPDFDDVYKNHVVPNAKRDVAGMLNLHQQLTSRHLINTYTFSAVIPKEFISNGENNDKPPFRGI
jgi:hypothetical protein